MNILHPRVVVLIPNLNGGIPRLGLAHLLSEMYQTHQVDSTRSCLKVFDFAEKYKDFISSNQFTTEEKNFSFFLNYYSAIIFAANSHPMFVNFDLEIMSIIQSKLRRQTPCVKFFVILHSSIRYDTKDDCEVIFENGITPGMELQAKIFDALNSC